MADIIQWLNSLPANAWFEEWGVNPALLGSIIGFAIYSLLFNKSG